MSYCTLEDLKTTVPEEKLIELSDDSIPPVAIDEDVVDEKIADADDLIDGYLRGRYTLPLSVTPRTIKNLSVDIAVYNLYTRRPERGIPEEISRKYEVALKLLSDIKKDNFSLDAEREGPSDPGYGSGYCRVNKTEEDRIFTKDLLSKF